MLTLSLLCVQTFCLPRHTSPCRCSYLGQFMNVVSSPKNKKKWGWQHLFLALHRCNMGCSPFIVPGDMNIANKRTYCAGNELVLVFHMKRACHSLLHTCTPDCRVRAPPLPHLCSAVTFSPFPPFSFFFLFFFNLSITKWMINDLLYYFPVRPLLPRGMRGSRSDGAFVTFSPKGVVRRIEA